MGNSELGTLVAVGAIGFILLSQRDHAFVGALSIEARRQITRECNRKARAKIEPLRQKALLNLESKTVSNIKLVYYKYAEMVRLEELNCVKRAGVPPIPRLSKSVTSTGGNYAV